MLRHLNRGNGAIRPVGRKARILIAPGHSIWMLGAGVVIVDSPYYFQRTTPAGEDNSIGGTRAEPLGGADSGRSAERMRGRSGPANPSRSQRRFAGVEHGFERTAAELVLGIYLTRYRAAPGPHWYDVRVEQQDGQLADPDLGTAAWKPLQTRTV